VAVIQLVLLALIGLGAGSLAAALGTGGGIIFVPVLAVLFAFDQHVAQGTSLAVILPTAIVGTIGHARAGRVRWPVAIPLAIAGVVGGVIGARIALTLDDSLLRRLFAVFLIVMAARMAWRTVALVRMRGSSD